MCDLLHFCFLVWIRHFLVSSDSPDRIGSRNILGSCCSDSRPSTGATLYDHGFGAIPFTKILSGRG